VILIGKDGEVKFREQLPVDLSDILAVIDAMPMRQRRCERDQNKPQGRRKWQNKLVMESMPSICVLAMHQEFEEIKAVTKNPQHICFNCGRVADAEKNLCNPRPLK